MRFKQSVSLLSLVFTIHLALGEVISGVVIAVSDGDTLKVLTEDQVPKTVRLAGVDTPEKPQEFGQQAKDELTALCLHKSVHADVRAIDRYGRTVARVHCEGIDAAAKMLQQGLAWHFTRYAHTQPKEESESDRLEQSKAQEAKRGLWSLPEPVAPWDWRSKRN